MSPSPTIVSTSSTKKSISSRSADANNPTKASSLSRPSNSPIENSLFKTTKDAFEELRYNSLRREGIAKEYSRAIDEVTNRMRDANIADETENLINAFGQVLRMFASGHQNLDYREESKSTHDSMQYPVRPILSQPQAGRTSSTRDTMNLMKKQSSLAQSPKTDNTANKTVIQSPDGHLSSPGSLYISPPNGTYEDYINDKPYCVGWSKVSSQYRCKQRRACKCATTGDCMRDVFYNYLIDDTMLHDDVSLLKKQCVIEISGFDAETPSAEEIRISKRNLGTAHAYYAKNIGQGSDYTTLLSISTHIYKSVCFMVECIILAVSKDKAQDYNILLDSQQADQTTVVCMRQDIVDILTDVVYDIGREPVVPISGEFDVSYKDDNDVMNTIRANKKNLYTKKLGPLVSGSQSLNMKKVASATEQGILAIRLARATISVSLKPCSLKAGKKNYSSKLVEYFVHAVSIDG